MQIDFNVRGCVLMDRETLEDILFDIENDILIIKARIKAIKRLSNMIFDEIFGKIWDTDHESLIALKYQVDYYDIIFNMIVDYLSFLNNDIDKINKKFSDARNKREEEEGEHKA